MKKLILLASLALSSAFAVPRSAVLPTTAATGTVYSSGLGSTNMTAVWWLHGQTTNSNVGTVAGMSIFRSSGVYFFSAADTLTGGSGNCNVPDVPSGQAILLRVIRDYTNLKMYFDIQDVESGDFYPVFGDYATPDKKACQFTISTPASGATIGGAGHSIGGAGATGSIAFMRWYTGAQTPGSTINLFTVGDLGNWEFDADTRVDSAHAQNLTSGGSYGDTPLYMPRCHPGTLQSTPTTLGTFSLDGSVSTALDGNSGLTYAWSVISSPVSVSISNGNVMSPSVTGATDFGTYRFQLQVTDASFNVKACSIKHGATIVKSNGQIDLTAQGVTAAAQKFIGPMTRFGDNPWPWADDRAKYALDYVRGMLTTTYKPYWRTPLTGKVTVTNGNTEVVGSSGANMLIPCGGSGTTPIDSGNQSTVLILIYTGTDGLTHYTAPRVTSCTDSTHLNVSFAGDRGPGYPTGTPPGALPNCVSGCEMDWQWGTGGAGYGDQSNYVYWVYNGAPANFYDAAKGMYIMYQRTGVDDYLTAFRNFSDYLWEFPNRDHGQSCLVSNQVNNICPPWRAQSVQSTFLRALEEGDSSPKWAGLRIMWAQNMYYLAYQASTYYMGAGLGGTADLRETSYMNSVAAYCAIGDPLEAQRNTCKEALKDAVNDLWTPFKRTEQGGSWAYFYSIEAPYTSTTDMGRTGLGYVEVTNGSSTVVGVGTNWPALNDIALWMWDGDPTLIPDNNANGDARTYIASTTDATHLTLRNVDGGAAVPYEGATCTGTCHKGFAMNLAHSAVGWSTQPWMVGFVGQTLDYTVDALEGYDTPSRTAALAHVDFASKFVKRSGYADPAVLSGTGGLYNNVYAPGCIPPIAKTNVICYPIDGANDPDWTRTLSMDAMGGLVRAYIRNPTWELRNFLDALMTEMFSKLGTGGLGGGDGFYLKKFDPRGDAYAAFSTKFPGQLTGYSEAATMWPAVRDVVFPLVAPKVSGGTPRGGVVR